jgi:hypothetical protein
VSWSAVVFKKGHREYWRYWWCVLRSLTVLTYCIASLNSLALFCSFLCFAHSFTSPTQEQRPLLAPRTCAPATAFSYTQGAQDRGKFTHTPSLLHTHTPFLLHTPFHTPRPQHWPLILTAIASLPPCCCVLMSSRCNAVIVPIS